MFLSKRYNGIYYLWFIDEGGKKQKFTTGCRFKIDALKFVQDFIGGEKKRREHIKLKSLCEFSSD